LTAAGLVPGRAHVEQALASSSEAMARKATTVEVEIYGASYHVRGDNDSEYLQELAGIVDTKMREVAQHVTTVDTTKLAILAALNIADELFQCRKRQEGERVAVAERLAELTGELEEAVGS
jgi:cell division protein ZapA